MRFNEKKSDPRHISLPDRVSGSWIIPNKKSRTFVAHSNGTLHFPVGRAWVTVNRGNARAAVDLFLDAHNSLPLQAGQVLVVESWSAGSEAELHVRWEPVVRRQPGSAKALRVLQAWHSIAAMSLVCQRWIFTKFLRNS